MVLRQITDELMYEIRELSGYEYVDVYATKQHGANDDAAMIPNPAVITRMAS